MFERLLQAFICMGPIGLTLTVFYFSEQPSHYLTSCTVRVCLRHLGCVQDNPRHHLRPPTTYDQICFAMQDMERELESDLAAEPEERAILRRRCSSRSSSKGSSWSERITLLLRHLLISVCSKISICASCYPAVVKQEQENAKSVMVWVSLGLYFAESFADCVAGFRIRDLGYTCPGGPRWSGTEFASCPRVCLKEGHADPYNSQIPNS